MKVGKEEIAGLVAAFERFLDRDFAADLARWEASVATILDAIRGVPGIQAERAFDNPEDAEMHPVAVPRVWIELRDAARRKRALAELESGNPAISVRRVGRTTLVIAPDSLREGEDAIVGARLREALGRG